MGFMDTAFETVIMFSAVDMVTGPMNKMAASMGIVSQRSKELQSTLNGYRNMAFVGAGITAVGVVLADGFLKAANAAGQFQQSMMSVKEAMGLTNAEFQKAMNMAQTMGIPTIFSAQQVGGIMATAANAGMSKSSVLNPNIMSQFVNFADVQAQGTKQEDPNTVVAAAIKIANLAGISGTQNTATFLDQLNAALMHTTDTATQFATNMRYYVGTAQMMGMSTSDVLTMNTWLSRMGLGGGRGGMATQQFLSRSIYGSSGTAADKAMQQAGFVVNGHSVFEDAKGAFVGIPAAAQSLQDFGKRFHEDSNQMIPILKSIFGVSGEKVALALANPNAAANYTNVQQQMGATPGVNTMQAAFNANWQGQVRELETTLQDIYMNFGQYAMAGLVNNLKYINDILASVLKFQQAHPTLMAIIADFVKWTAIILLTVGPLMIIIGALGWIGNSGYIVTGLQMIGKAFTTLGAPLVKLTTWLWENQGAMLAQNAAAMASQVGLKLLTAAQWLWNLACDADPLVWIIAGIVALGVAIVELIVHWKDVCTWIENAWNWLNKWNKTPAAPPLAAAKTPAISPQTQQQIHTAVQKVTNPLGSLPPMPGYASGTNSAAGGWSLVGEHGAELVNLTRGSQVINNASLSGMLGNVSMGGVNINIYPTPNQSPADIAKAASKELGRVIRNGRRGRTLTPVSAW